MASVPCMRGSFLKTPVQREEQMGTRLCEVPQKISEERVAVKQILFKLWNKQMLIGQTVCLPCWDKYCSHFLGCVCSVGRNAPGVGSLWGQRGFSHAVEPWCQAPTCKASSLQVPFVDDALGVSGVSLAHIWFQLQVGWPLPTRLPLSAPAHVRPASLCNLRCRTDLRVPECKYGDEGPTTNPQPMGGKRQRITEPASWLLARRCWEAWRIPDVGAGAELSS